MADSLPRVLIGLLSESEMKEVGSVAIQRSSDRLADLPALLEAWRLHVDRMERELDSPGTDRTVWGAHDLLAALFLRDSVAEGVARLRSPLALKVSGILAPIDADFVSYTEEDSSGCITQIGGDSPGEGWWWRRIPVRGPIREEINKICGY